jgi:MFS family permease
MDDGSILQNRPDDGWARQQRLLAGIGTLLALAGLITAILALTALSPVAGAAGYAVAAVISVAVLLACCGLITWTWTGQLSDWRSGTDGDYRGRCRISLISHLVSYAAVLGAMYTTLAGSALAGWASGSGTLFGISFLLAIFAQIIGGTQLLRRSGPPGTIPTYLRRLNAKVQSLR